MQARIEKAQADLRSLAYARLGARDLFSGQQLAFMAQACADVPKEPIGRGDVGRFMEDKKDPIGRVVVELLNMGKCREFLSGLMDGEYYVLHCQANLLRQGGFIGKHIDTCSNLDCRYSCVIQFGREYEGGEFFIETDGVEQEIKTHYADFLVNRCEVPHGVRAVKAGNRTSLVFFLSKTPLSMPNHNHADIRRT
jgi:hypothetical protein